AATQCASHGAAEPARRLVLGTAALQVARGNVAALRRGFEGWQHLSRSPEIAASPVWRDRTSGPTVRTNSPVRFVPPRSCAVANRSRGTVRATSTRTSAASISSPMRAVGLDQEPGRASTASTTAASSSDPPAGRGDDRPVRAQRADQPRVLASADQLDDHLDVLDHAGAVPAERRLTQDPGRPVPLPGLPADGGHPGGADADPDRSEE